MNRLEKYIRPRAGMTLAEVIVSMAVIAVCAVTLAMAYRAALAVMRHSADSARDADLAFAASQLATGETLDTSISFQAGGRRYTVNGTLSVGRTGDAEYYSFEPNVAGGAR